MADGEGAAQREGADDDGVMELLELQNGRDKTI
jgi:hypothetical protein